jgi:hypothetical protein
MWSKHRLKVPICSIGKGGKTRERDLLSMQVRGYCRCLYKCCEIFSHNCQKFREEQQLLVERGNILNPSST